MREGALVRHLRSRHVLWLHGWAMGLLTLGRIVAAGDARAGGAIRLNPLSRRGAWLTIPSSSARS